MSTPDTAKDFRARFEADTLPLMPAVHRFASRLARRPEDAKDLVQEAYLRAYRTFGNFRPGTNTKAWLFTIVYSVFVNRWHKERKESANVSVEELEERFHRVLVDERPVPPWGEGAASSRAWADPEVETALQRLPENFRSAVLLVDVEELSYEEAAAALGCPVGTLRSRLFRGRKALFGELLEYARRSGHFPANSEKE